MLHLSKKRKLMADASEVGKVGIGHKLISLLVIEVEF